MAGIINILSSAIVSDICIIYVYFPNCKSWNKKYQFEHWF